jgi:hypothetical protein
MKSVGVEPWRNVGVHVQITPRTMGERNADDKELVLVMESRPSVAFCLILS